ncbi:MAG: 3-keto-disaccharide hydrolase [Thermoguttaceae bacterium]
MKPSLPLAALLLLVLGLLPAGRSHAADNRSPIVPTGGAIRLFNGVDLAGFYVFMQDTKYEDPRHVFTVHDGLLHVSGDGFGGLCTEKEYANYHMICEFKWGARTWGRREKSARDSGILVHCTGPDGAYSGIWMASIEAQIIEGGVGDVLVVPGKDAGGRPVPLSLTADVVKDRNGQSVWSKEGTAQTFTSGRINWWGRDPDWKDQLGVRGPHDQDSAVGEWTRMDVICDRDRITVKVNGSVVNCGYNAIPQAGKLTLQTELAEIFVRRWELWPLGKAPE